MKREEILELVKKVAVRASNVAVATAVSAEGETVDLTENLKTASVALCWVAKLLEGDEGVVRDPDKALSAIAYGYLNVLYTGGDGDGR